MLDVAKICRPLRLSAEGVLLVRGLFDVIFIDDSSCQKTSKEQQVCKLLYAINNKDVRMSSQSESIGIFQSL